MRLRAVFIPMAALVLFGCGEGDLAGMKDAAVGAAQGAANVAAQFVTTEQACVAAGQNEAFCGCLQTRLGERLQPEQIEAIAGVIRAGLNGGVQAAAENSTTIDPATRDAVVGCAAQAAVGGGAPEAAEGAETGQ
jgi:hypothetical protein